MNSTITYTCLNCDAGLLFDADKQTFSCEFCLSTFTEAELARSRAAEREAKKARAEEEFDEAIDQYICQSCGAEVIADKNTLADFCYYCHNPIVLSGKATGALRPSKIIPFKYSKEEAKEKFLAYARSHWFVPRDYYSKENIERLSGVYYPFWVTDADTDSALRAVGKTVRSWRSGDYRYTETKSYSVYRRGRIHFEDITTSALSTEDKAMLEGILPYPPEEHRDFAMPYLQGFVAKKRDIERDSLGDEVKGRMKGYADTLLKRTATGYSSLETTKLDVAILSSHWEYSLMPIYILTYEKKGKKFIYAMNGCTGKVYGELPVSIPKLLLFGLGIFLAAALVTAGIFLLVNYLQ